MPHPALAVLDRQRDAWNAGDLDGYVGACAADVVYVNSAGPCLGRDALARTLGAAYPDRAAMGTLSLDVLRLDPLGDPETDGAVAVVTLRWEVHAGGGVKGGHAVLVLQRVQGAWCMSHDATVAGATGGR